MALSQPLLGAPPKLLGAPSSTQGKARQAQHNHQLLRTESCVALLALELIDLGLGRKAETTSFVVGKKMSSQQMQMQMQNSGGSSSISSNIPVSEVFWTLVDKADKKFSKIRDLPFYQRSRSQFSNFSFSFLNS